MYRINQLKLNINHTTDELKVKLCNTLKMEFDDIDWSSFTILHRSKNKRDGVYYCNKRDTVD